MAHECLFLAPTSGPILTNGSTTIVQCGYPEWNIYLPPNSIYVGKALRFRGGGWIDCMTPSAGLRWSIGHFVSAPAATLAPLAYYTITAMTPRVIGKQLHAEFSFDLSAVCRTVGITTTAWFFTGIFASANLINYGGTAGTATTGLPVVNPVISPPVVSTIKHTNVADVWMGPGFTTNSSGCIFNTQMHNYRVDAIA